MEIVKKYQPYRLQCRMIDWYRDLKRFVIEGERIEQKKICWDRIRSTGQARPVTKKPKTAREEREKKNKLAEYLKQMGEEKNGKEGRFVCYRKRGVWYRYGWQGFTRELFLLLSSTCFLFSLFFSFYLYCSILASATH